ncbi:MAG TPA: hypothetical protein VN696_14680 [Pyrinomonadaceae bacterium]|nr:hypothetical protein [Pyrinomonadaceae bacterium]
MEDFGPRVRNAWEGLRPTTRSLLERAWKSPSASTPARGGAYDPRTDRELSELLAALDERAEGTESSADEPTKRAQELADACAQMLSEQTQSAEVFGQLIQRAHSRRDYARLDQLANGMSQRLAPSELCDLARSGNVVVRALAHEVLAQAPTFLLAALLHDPVDAEVARAVLERQAHEFGSEEAKRLIHQIDEFGM